MTAVRREIVLPVKRDRAWTLLTEPRELTEWLPTRSTSSARRARRCA